MTQSKTKSSKKDKQQPSQKTAIAWYKVFRWDIFLRILELIKPYKKQFYISALLTLVLAVLTPARPYIIQLSIDDYIFFNDMQGLLLMTILLIALVIVESICRYFFIYITNWLGQSVIKDLRTKIFKHIISLKLGFFDKTPIGALTTRTINDVEAVKETFSSALIAIVSDILILITVIIIMFWTDWRLTCISLSILPLMLLATYIFQVHVRSAFQVIRTQVSRMNTFLQEHISGMSIVQIFSREKQEMEKFKTINKRHRQANIRAIWYYSIFFPVVELFSAASIALLIWWGGSSVIDDNITLGTLIAFILYINMLFRPIRMLADKFNTLQMGFVASERIFKILDTTEEIENIGTLVPDTIRGEIQFKNIWFAYNENDYVLKNISFRVKAGEAIAIVGATGSGKTSIINILNRFYETNKGKIMVDGIDIKKYDLQALRSNIGVVLQDVFLFSGSIANNITLNNEHISKQQFMDAAEMIGADKFIKKLPKGYDYDVMERGVTLSYGQRQLIAFIRALVFSPNILILDEATSSVDSGSEELIKKATEKLIKNRTSIIIAHRLSTIQHADRILVLDQGEIKEMGTHKELLKIDGLYKKLHEVQFKEFI